MVEPSWLCELRGRYGTLRADGMGAVAFQQGSKKRSDNELWLRGSAVCDVPPEEVGRARGPAAGVGVGAGRELFHREADMMNRIRWIMPLALLAVIGFGAPEKAHAASCTDRYMSCLNDSWHTSGFARMLADVECAAEYVGCVRRKV
jgi:hypothetical protein